MQQADSYQPGWGEMVYEDGVQRKGQGPEI
jgi:hypothetical protein